MATSYTPRLGLPEMADGEGSGYVTYNDLGRVLDLFLQPSLITTTLVDPPSVPPDGGCYLVPESGATGVWAGHDGELAQWYNGLWYFYPVPTGFDIHDQENNLRWTQGKLDPYIGHVSVGQAVLRLSQAASTPIGSIGTSGTKITVFDEKVLPMVDAFASITNSTISFSEPGLWLVVILLDATVDESTGNTTRDVELYPYNETKAIELDSIAGGSIPRYGTIMSLSGASVVPISADVVDDEFSIYVRRSTTNGTNVIPSATNACSFSVIRVSHADIVPSIVTSD